MPLVLTAFLSTFPLLEEVVVAAMVADAIVVFG